MGTRGMCALPVGPAIPRDGSEGTSASPGASSARPVAGAPGSQQQRAPRAAARGPVGSRRLAHSKLKPGRSLFSPLRSAGRRLPGHSCHHGGGSRTSARDSAAGRRGRGGGRARDRTHVAPRALGLGPASPRHLGKPRLPGLADGKTQAERTQELAPHVPPGWAPQAGAGGDPHNCLPPTGGNRGREARVTRQNQDPTPGRPPPASGPAIAVTIERSGAVTTDPWLGTAGCCGLHISHDTGLYLVSRISFLPHRQIPGT